MAHVRRVAPRRKPTKASARYKFGVIIKEKEVEVFADTGADVSVISMTLAKELKLELQKANLKLKPFGSKSIRCKHAYIGTVMYGENVANVKLYVIPKDVETLLSGAAAEALGIISLHRSHNEQPTGIKRVITDQAVNKLLNEFPNVQNGTGKLKNY